MREGYKVTEMGEIPVEWEVQKIAEIANVNPNYKLKRGELYDYIDMAALPIEGKEIKDISKREFGVYSGSKFKNGDTLFARINPCTQNGKIGLVNGLSTGYGLGSTEFIVLSPKENKVIPEYLFYYTKLDKVKSYAVSRMLGTTGRQRVQNEVFKEELMIPVPSLPEQQKIAKILSTVDEQIEQTDQLIEKTQELKKGLMQKLFTKGIGHTEFKKTEVGEIPVEWEVGTLGECSIKITQGPNPKYNLGQPVNKYRVLKTKDLYDHWVLYDNADIISEETFESCKSAELEDKDILVAIVGKGSIGKSNIFRKQNNARFIFSRAIGLVRLNQSYLVPEFIHQYFQSPIGKAILERGINGSTGQEVLQTSFLKDITVAVPPLPEQKQIADILSSVDTQLDHYESKKQKLKSLKKGLMQKLLTGKIRVKVS